MASPVPSLKHQETKRRNVMLLFRTLCAVIVAWSVNWVMAQPVSANLLELVPEMHVIAPLSGAVVGFMMLAKRQGWGFVVALANGLWTMIMVVAVSWLIFLVVTLFDHLVHGLIDDFENFLRILGSETRPLAEGWVDIRLAGVLLGAAVVASVVTEALHWILVRLRRLHGEDDEESRTEREAENA